MANPCTLFHTYISSSFDDFVKSFCVHSCFLFEVVNLWE